MKTTYLERYRQAQMDYEREISRLKDQIARMKLQAQDAEERLKELTGSK